MLAIADFFSLALVRIVIGVMNILPRSLGYFLARVVVRLVLIFLPRSKGVAMRNLAVAFPELNQGEHLKIYRNSIRVLAKNLLGFARIPRLNPSLAAQMIDYSAARAALEAHHAARPNKGVLIATLHYGCAETLVQLHAIHCGGLGVLARGFGLPKLDAWWNGRRELFGNQIFSRAGGYQEIVTRLQAGQDVTLLCDQNVKRNHAVFVDFFGVKAATTKSVGLAALRTDAAVAIAVAHETREDRYDVVFEQLRHPSEFPGERAEQIEAFTAYLNQRIEYLVRQRPEQWFWIHRRWKTRPPGEPETFYSEAPIIRHSSSGNQPDRG